MPGRDSFGVFARLRNEHIRGEPEARHPGTILPINDLRVISQPPDKLYFVEGFHNMLCLIEYKGGDAKSRYQYNTRLLPFYQTDNY
jgi:hypothetical protein